LAQLRGELINLRNDYYQSAQKEATRLQAELVSTGRRLDERQSVLDHTTLISAVTGIVKYLSVTTLGGVLRAGTRAVIRYLIKTIQRSFQGGRSEG
jgi:adhesin transport system membrane fusion protein